MSSKIFARRSFAAGALVAGVLGATSMQAGAAPITIVNPSFENNTNFGNVGTAWVGGASDGVRNYGSNVSLAAIDGLRHLALNNNYTPLVQSVQTTAFSVAEAGQIISLTVGVGNNSNGGSTVAGSMPASHYYGTIYLQINGVDVATNSLANPNAFTPTAPSTSFADATLAYTTSAADIGQLVGVRFSVGEKVIVGQKQAAFDNVRLSVVPEPASAAILLGFGGVLLAARRRRSAN